MRKSNYDKYPEIKITDRNEEAFAGYDSIVSEIKRKGEALNKKRTIVTVDCYPGVLDSELFPALMERLHPSFTAKASDANFCKEKVFEMIKYNLTEDRVRGIMSHFKMADFFDVEKLEIIKNQIEEVQEGIVLVYGCGASLLAEPDVLIYADMARWELQLRYKRGETANWLTDNYGEDFLQMYKRGFFVDWRVADRHKNQLFDRVDYLLDTNEKEKPKMLTGRLFHDALHKTAGRPFRVVPYFDAGPWGGQWMKEVCDLNKNAPNFAWGFDCVPEENSLFLVCGNIRVEIPAINLVMRQGKRLLGDKVHARFGDEFPIRFDFLDTMGGGNLSLQVHPDTKYIQDNFGMNYTQDESYYILDAGEDAHVYLGTKNNIVKKQMLDDLNRTQNGEIVFDAEKYINKFPAKKHDHFLIPAGTIHCSGANSMVLEISATPYIFTFKLWDWGQLGLDGKPRPIHIDHGENVINWDWQTDTIIEKHINQIEVLAEEEGWREERTGLHKREFIETRRHWFSKKIECDTNDCVNVLNLVEGDEAVVESPTNSFEPFVVHYAETFIIPASVGQYTLCPCGLSASKKCGVIIASIRT